MSFQPRNFARSVAVAWLSVALVSLPRLQGQDKPPSAEDGKCASLGHGNPLLPLPEGGNLAQTYKTYPDPKPKVVKDGPVNVTTVSKAAEKLIEVELSPRKCKPRSGVCLRTGNQWLCTYQLQYEAIPIATTTDAMCIIHHDGHALIFRKRNIPRKVNATRATVDGKTAVAMGLKDFAERCKGKKSDTTEPSLEIRVDAEQNGRLCWTFTVTNGSLTQPCAARYWVSAADEPRIVAVENLIHHAHAGTVTGNVWAASPLQPAERLPLPFLDVTSSKAGGGPRPTGRGGEYVFMPGRGKVQMRASLVGPGCRIEDYSGGSALTRIQSGDESGPINLDFDVKDEFELAQVTAFYWTSLARDFVKDFLLPSHLWQLTTRVNLDWTCNAGFSGADMSINFFRAGKGCRNTAHCDIVLHEYGHAIDFLHGGILDGGYSEGFGDALAILVTHQPLIGRDLFGPGTFLRDARKAATFPSANPEPHVVGRIYAGFTWELVERLKKRVGHHSDEEAFGIAKRLILAADAMNPKDIPDAVWLAFLADDDDGDLTNGSPHFEQLAAAADSRKIPRPPDPKATRGPRHAYLGDRGAHHLTLGTGTGLYLWKGSQHLVTLKLEKEDKEYWYYCEQERPGYRWAFARKADDCARFAVWFSPSDRVDEEWAFFQFARQATPALGAEKGRE